MKNFNVADNLGELKNELSYSRKELNELHNKIFVLKRQKEKIIKSLEDNIFYSEEKVLEKYNSYKNIFKEDIVKEIDDVIKFHKELLSNRKGRLSKQLYIIENNINSYEIKSNGLGKRIDEIYKSLNSSIDLSELTSLTTEINQLKIQYEKLDSYTNVLKKQDNKKLSIENKFAMQNIEAQNYIAQVESIIDDISNVFNEYVYEMYGNDINSYIKLINNTATNASRYNFEIKIPNDNSDGIRHSEICSFDLMLRKKGKNVFDFLIHDNKIFYGWDYSNIVKILKKLANDGIDYQYIFSINQSEYEGLKDEFNDDELFNLLIEQNIKVRLKSDSKLLGFDIDLKKM